MREVEYLKKEDINSYIKFIKEVFDYETKEENIEKLIKNNVGKKIIKSKSLNFISVYILPV